MKKFTQRIKESSYFHSMEDIDKILDKIHDSGLGSLTASEKFILLNYSKNDEIIHKILSEVSKLTKKFKELNDEISRLSKNDPVKAKQKFNNEWLKLNDEMSQYEEVLREIFKIEDPYLVHNYQKKHGLIDDSQI